MPLEIRELIIRAVVDSDNKRTDRTLASGNFQVSGLQEQEVNEIVKQCVEKVLEILKEKSER